MTTQNEIPDATNGYEAVAGRYMAYRAQSNVGAATVREWARDLRRGGAVLDLGCGSGRPISQVFIEEGYGLYGVDASVSMIAALRAQFPSAQTECGAVERSEFFARTFDGVVAWGLMFLLAPDAQVLLIRKVAGALNSGGKFLFTAPHQVCEWPDALTGRRSVSLGVDAYRRTLAAEGLALVDERQDEGENDYYFASKTPNQPSEPTSPSVTDRAAHAPRQLASWLT